MNKTAKQRWIDRQCMKKAGRYTTEEVQAYRAELERKYQWADMHEFELALVREYGR